MTLGELSELLKGLEQRYDPDTPILGMTSLPRDSGSIEVLSGRSVAWCEVGESVVVRAEGSHPVTLYLAP